MAMEAKAHGPKYDFRGNIWHITCACGYRSEEATKEQAEGWYAQHLEDERYALFDMPPAPRAVNRKGQV